MQCNDIDIPNVLVNNLDSALHELGMLSTCTNSRQEYLKEIQNKQMMNMLTINTRYVSNVSIGFRVRPVTPHVRYKPYNVPKREERHRTRSENNDNESTNVVPTIAVQEIPNEVSCLKKAKSLESITLENIKPSGSALRNLPEVEIVSNCIEKLKVDE